MLAKDELVALLQKCVETLQSVKSKKMKKALGHLKELLTKFQQMDGKQGLGPQEAEGWYVMIQDC